MEGDTDPSGRGGIANQSVGPGSMAWPPGKRRPRMTRSRALLLAACGFLPLACSGGDGPPTLAGADLPSTYMYVVYFQSSGSDPILTSFWGVGDTATQTGTDQGVGDTNFTPYVQACNANGCVVGGRSDAFQSTTGVVWTYTSNGDASVGNGSFDDPVTAVTPPTQSGVIFVATSAPSVSVCQFGDPGDCASDLTYDFPATINALALDWWANQLWVGLDDGQLFNCDIADGTNQLDCSVAQTFSTAITSLACLPPMSVGENTPRLAVVLFDDTYVHWLTFEGDWNQVLTPATASSDPDGPYMNVAFDGWGLF